MLSIFLAVWPLFICRCGWPLPCKNRESTSKVGMARDISVGVLVCVRARGLCRAAAPYRNPYHCRRPRCTLHRLQFCFAMYTSSALFASHLSRIQEFQVYYSTRMWDSSVEVALCFPLVRKPRCFISFCFEVLRLRIVSRIWKQDFTQWQKKKHVLIVALN